MDEMITAQEAYETAEKNSMVSTESDVVKRFLPEISELVKDAASRSSRCGAVVNESD